MTMRRNSALALAVDTELNAKGELKIRVQVGAGFHGPREVLLTSTDRETLRGEIDGKAIAPFSIHAKPGSMKLADGTAVPGGAIDADIRQAIPALMRSLQDRCPAAKAPPMPLPPSSSGGADPPGHYTDTLGSSGCVGCQAGTGAGEIICLAVAATASISCLFAYPICLAVAAAACVAAYFITLCTGCHVAEFPGCGGGGPCCPTDCTKDFCCGVGETCFGPNGLCCAPGFKGCGDRNCCASTDQCLGNGTCCPADHSACNGVCCPNTDQICNPNTQACCKQGAVCGNSCCDGPDQVCVSSSSSTCCASAHACGALCCAKSESCTDPNHGTCSACSDCTGPGKECCFGQCCAGAQIFCDTTSRSCKCKPNCDGKCGGAPDGCGGTCDGGCAEFFVCYQHSCCSPDCDGKCGGVSDGCGGTCSGCSQNQVCRGKSCCTLKCLNQHCGAADGCGGKCVGLCPDGTVCNKQHACQKTGACAVGRVNCCGDGSCCRPPGECFACRCNNQ